MKASHWSVQQDVCAAVDLGLTWNGAPFPHLIPGSRVRKILSCERNSWEITLDHFTLNRVFQSFISPSLGHSSHSSENIYFPLNMAFEIAFVCKSYLADACRYITYIIKHFVQEAATSNLTCRWVWPQLRYNGRPKYQQEFGEPIIYFQELPMVSRTVIVGKKNMETHLHVTIIEKKNELKKPGAFSWNACFEVATLSDNYSIRF